MLRTVTVVFGATLGLALSTLAAQEPQAYRGTLKGSSVPFFTVFEQFLRHCATAYQEGDQSYRDLLSLFDLNPDLAAANDLPLELARMDWELEEMQPATGDRDLDNAQREDRKVELLGRIYGRLIAAAAAEEVVPGRVELKFYNKLITRLRPTIVVRYYHQELRLEVLAERQRAFDQADRKARAALAEQF